MEQALAERLERYQAQYPKSIRDLAETYCSTTTRLGVAGAPPATAEQVHLIAQSHSVDANILFAAVTEYSQIDASLEANALKNFRRGSSAPSLAPTRWWSRWWPRR